MKQRNFTLVELMITIGIIIVLAGMLIPAVNGAIKKGEMAKAKSQAVTLANAIKQFEATYGYMPSSTKDDKLLTKDGEIDKPNDEDQYKKFIQMLQGVSTGCDKLNKRQIKFLDISTAEGEYKDPWDQNFNIRFDVNSNSHISAIDGISGGAYVNVVVWSDGPTTNAKDNVYSINVVWNKASNTWELTH